MEKPPPVDPLPTGRVVTKYRNLGTRPGNAPVLDLDVGGDDVTYDFTGTMRETKLKNPPRDLTWDGKRNLWRCDGRNGGKDHGKVRVIFGAGFCPNVTENQDWNDLYQPKNEPRALMVIRECAINEMTIEHVRAHGLGWDVVSFGSGTRDSVKKVIVRHLFSTMQRDEPFENDTWVPMVIEDGYAESFVLYSCNNKGFDGSRRITTIQGTMHYLLPCRIYDESNRIGSIFKLDPNSVMLRIINDVFGIPAADGFPAKDKTRAVFGDLIEHKKLHPDSGGNTICLLGGQKEVPNGNPDPDRFKVLRGDEAHNHWNGAKAAAWSKFRGRRFSFDPPA